MERLIEDLPQELAEEIKTYDSAEELRLRKDRKTVLIKNGKEIVLDYVPKDIRAIISRLCGYSMPSIANELKQAFFSYKGLRIGVGGSFVSKSGEICGMNDFDSISVRFSGQIFGISTFPSKFIKRQGNILSTLIISPPGMGKTTLLRDIVYSVSEGINFNPMNCTVIDERNELFPNGYKKGMRTDLLTFCPKTEGITMGLRSLSPSLIAFDEIGSEEELYAAYDASLCGVKILTSCHAGSFDELSERFFIKKMLSMGLFKRIIVLSDSIGKGTLEEIRTNSGEIIYPGRTRLLGTELRKETP